MGNRRKQGSPLKPYQTAQTGQWFERDKETYTMIGDTLLDSPVVNSLSGTAYKVLVNMIRYAARFEVSKTNDSRKGFIFPRAIYENVLRISHNACIRAVRELESGGFIKVLRYPKGSRRPNEYIMIGIWKVHHNETSQFFDSPKKGHVQVLKKDT